MSDGTSWRETLKNSRNLQIQWLVVSTLCQEMKNHLNQKVGFEGTNKIGSVLEVTTSYLQGKYGVEIRIESVNKDNCHSWVRISHGLNMLVTELSNKQGERQQRAGKLRDAVRQSLRWNWMHVLLRADQRPKQNHEDVLLPAHPQELHPSGKESGLMLSQKIVPQSITQCQNNWVLFFVMVTYLEKTMERLNSGD